MHRALIVPRLDVPKKQITFLLSLGPLGRRTKTPVWVSSPPPLQPPGLKLNILGVFQLKLCRLGRVGQFAVWPRREVLRGQSVSGCNRSWKGQSCVTRVLIWKTSGHPLDKHTTASGSFVKTGSGSAAAFHLQQHGLPLPVRCCRKDKLGRRRNSVQRHLQWITREPGLYEKTREIAAPPSICNTSHGFHRGKRMDIRIHLWSHES